MTKTRLSILFILGISFVVFCGATRGCSDANVVSANLSTAADNFEINRRVVFYNGITGEYILQIEGCCSIDPVDKKLTVTVKTGPQEYKKHYLGLSDNVTYFAEQIDSAKTDPYRYRVIFKPVAILPSVEVK